MLHSRLLPHSTNYPWSSHCHCKYRDIYSWQPSIHTAISPYSPCLGLLWLPIPSLPCCPRAFKNPTKCCIALMLYSNIAIIILLKPEKDLYWHGREATGSWFKKMAMCENCTFHFMWRVFSAEKPSETNWVFLRQNVGKGSAVFAGTLL